MTAPYSWCLPLKSNLHLVLFSVYSPTLLADDKKQFYSDMRRHMNSAPAADKVLILSDFNARVGMDSVAWKRVLGLYGIGNCNENGCLLLEFCTVYQLAITNTIFQWKDRLKAIWVHPRSKQLHLPDYLLVCQLDLKDVLHMRVMPSADCCSGHCLILC